MDRVHREASGSALIIAMVTPTYQARPVCVAELGAAWARDVLFPVLAPGMDRSELEGVLPGLLIKQADDSAVLEELSDRIRELGFEFQSTSFGEGKAEWKSELRKGLVPAPLKAPPSADDMQRLEEELKSTEELLDKKNDELTKLKDRYAKLKKAKTEAAIQEADLPADEYERFAALRDTVATALRKLSTVVAEAVWHEAAGQEMRTPERYNFPDRCDDIETENKQGRLIVDEDDNTVRPNLHFPAVKQAYKAVADLRAYLTVGERSESFEDWFESTYETPMDLAKQACWDAVI